MILVPTFNSIEYDLDCFCILISDCDGVIMYTDSLAYIHCRFDTRYLSAKYAVENMLTEDRVISNWNWITVYIIYCYIIHYILMINLIYIIYRYFERHAFMEFLFVFHTITAFCCYINSSIENISATDISIENVSATDGRTINTCLTNVESFSSKVSSTLLVGLSF